MGDLRKQSRDELLALYFNTTVGRRPEIREALIEEFSYLPRAIARRFASRPPLLEDVEQAGVIGLICAVDRFDPSYCVAFTSFATPTIIGEIKRFFRDCTNDLKVARKMKELDSRLQKAARQLEMRLGRSPSMAEVAAEAGVSEKQAEGAWGTSSLPKAASLDATVYGEDLDGSLLESFGYEDQGIAAVLESCAMRSVLARLDPRKCYILTQRYLSPKPVSQAQVSSELGISQMHVSRLEREALRELRKYFPV